MKTGKDNDCSGIYIGSIDIKTNFKTKGKDHNSLIFYVP